MRFAERMRELESSAVRRMFELGLKMKNPIDLSLGQPHFDALDLVKKAAIQAIQDGKNGYTVTSGIPQLRDVILEKLANESINTGSVMVTSGASGALMLSLFTLADHNVEVLVTDPCFLTYKHLIKLAGSKPKFIDTYPDFKITPQNLQKALTPKTKILIFNSPVNPTGVAYTEEEIKALVRITKKHDIQVISDEVYNDFCYDFNHVSWLKYDNSAVLVRALSKSAGIPGWRVGYAAGPKEIIEQMIMLQQFTFICTHTPSQWASIVALNSDISHIISEYQQKRDMVYEQLKDYYEIVKPQGAFYVFPKVPNEDCNSFLQKCVEHELLIVPGGAFSIRNTHFRISYATTNTKLQKGIDLLKKLAK